MRRSHRVEPGPDQARSVRGILALALGADLASGKRLATVQSSAGIGFAACAGKHYFVIGTKAAFLAYPC